MDVAKEIDTMRGQIAGCDLAAFVDLGSKMVLYASTPGAPAQEHMDALTVAAESLLSGPLAKDAAASAGGGDDGLAAVTLTANEARLYLRSRSVATEALVLVCPPDTDISAAMDCARDTLERIVSAEA